MLRGELKTPGTQQMAITTVSSQVYFYRKKLSLSDKTSPTLLSVLRNKKYRDDNSQMLQCTENLSLSEVTTLNGFLIVSLSPLEELWAEKRLPDHCISEPR